MVTKIIQYKKKYDISSINNETVVLIVTIVITVSVMIVIIITIIKIRDMNKIIIKYITNYDGYKNSHNNDDHNGNSNISDKYDRKVVNIHVSQSIK